METAPRKMTFLLAEPERRVLRWIAARLPQPVLPNHLTILGILGALGVGAGYALTPRDPRWLWLASAMLAVNWFGDSLDGTVARVRQIERPRYGYYLDHMVDAFNTAVIGAGIGLSSFVSLELALLLVIIYLSLSINVYLESSVFGVFEFAYGIFGPTEVRIMLVMLNTGLWAGASYLAVSPEAFRRVANWVVVGLCVLMFATLAIRFATNLSRLRKLEPRHRG